MKKNEYVAPEMEIVEVTEQSYLLETSSGDLGEQTPNPGYPWD